MVDATTRLWSRAPTGREPDHDRASLLSFEADIPGERAMAAAGWACREAAKTVKPKSTLRLRGCAAPGVVASVPPPLRAAALGV